MRAIVRAIHWAVLAAGMLAMGANQSYAQQSDGDSAATGEPVQSGGLEEIVVTSQKRAENVQRVPIPISALTGQMLETMRIDDTTQLAQFVPGLNIPRANVTAVPFLRGVGNLSANPGNEPTIATYVDDVYYPSPAGSNYAYNNVSRIEVLKGPQGTLFGRNAAGGVINIITKDPSATPELHINAGYANYANVTGDIYGTTALSDNLVADLAVFVQNQDEGWGRNLATGAPVYLSKETSYRSKWVWTPSDDWTVRFIADYDHIRNDISSVLSIAPGTTNLFGQTKTGGFYDKAANSPARGQNRQYGFSLRVDHDFDWATATSITSYRNMYARGEGDNTDASALSLYRYDIIGIEEDTTQEFQLAAPADARMQWIGGLFYYYDRAGEDPLAAYGYGQTTHPGNMTAFTSMQRTTSYAAYTQATMPVFSPQTRLTLGLRYTHDERDITATYYEQDGTIFNFVPLQEKSWPKLTYRFALDHDFTDHVLGYVSYNRGFKSGYYATGSPTSPVVNPEVLDAYEIGFKSDLLGRTLRLNASAFFYQFDDIQIQQIVTINGRTTAAVMNAAGAEYKGVEVDATWQPTDNFTLYGSLALLDSEYTDFPNALFTFPCVTPTAAPSCATSVNGGGYFQRATDATGNTPTFADPATGTVTANYRIPTSFGEVALIGSVAYHDGFYFDVQNTLEQPSYTLVNASIRWTSPSETYDITLWSENLTDEEYYAQYQRSSTVATYSAQAPLTYGVKFGYHFGKR